MNKASWRKTPLSFSLKPLTIDKIVVYSLVYSSLFFTVPTLSFEWEQYFVKSDDYETRPKENMTTAVDTLIELFTLFLSSHIHCLSVERILEDT